MISKSRQEKGLQERQKKSQWRKLPLMHPTTGQRQISYTYVHKRRYFYVSGGVLYEFIVSMKLFL